MFTGLIECTGRLVARRQSDGAAKIRVAGGLNGAELAAGESVAVNGACLTVEECCTVSGESVITFHALQETLNRTNLGDLAENSPVNLERAMPADGRFGGHFVTGHVDATAPIETINRVEYDLLVTVRLPEELQPLVIPKGSIALDGISLTIAELQTDTFSVWLIPETVQNTNLAVRTAGDHVNLEGDIIGKYVLRQQQSTGGGLTMKDLAEAGF